MCLGRLIITNENIYAKWGVGVKKKKKQAEVTFQYCTVHFLWQSLEEPNQPPTLVVIQVVWAGFLKLSRLGTKLSREENTKSPSFFCSRHFLFIFCFPASLVEPGGEETVRDDT